MTGDELRELDELRNTIGFGLDVQVFMQNNSIGRYLELRAVETVEACLEELKTVDAENPKAIRELQSRIRSAENWMGWLDEAVAQGEQAEAVLRGDAALPSDEQD